MNSPDLTRLATALAKIDDEDIIQLLLSTYFPKPEPAPVVLKARPVQGELLGHVQERRTYKLNREPKRAKRRWTNLDKLTLIRMLNQDATLQDICEKLGRSNKAIESAVERWAPEFSAKVRSQSTYRRPS